MCWVKEVLQEATRVWIPQMTYSTQCPAGSHLFSGFSADFLQWVTSPCYQHLPGRESKWSPQLWCTMSFASQDAPDSLLLSSSYHWYQSRTYNGQTLPFQNLLCCCQAPSAFTKKPTNIHHKGLKTPFCVCNWELAFVQCGKEHQDDLLI